VASSYDLYSVVVGSPEDAGDDLPTRLEQVRASIADACGRAGRNPAEVRLIGVTKEVSPSAVRRAWDEGLTDFGENYVQDLEAKRGAAPEAAWHFIGRLQRNKVKRILGAADIVHSLEPGRAADRLAELAQGDVPIECLAEVDFTGQRVGVSPDELQPFLEELDAQPAIRLTGLMTVPPMDEDPRPYFARLRELRDRLQRAYGELRDLSMGMSADYEEAVEEGATMVRIGTAIFGPRPVGVRRSPGAGKP
jgi:pyridoxal phosphate enzyme (YggS family)